MAHCPRILIATLLGLTVAVLALVWLWHSGGKYVCSASFSSYDAKSSLCVGGKLGVDSYPVTTSMQLDGMLGVLGNLVELALLVVLVLRAPVAVLFLREKGNVR